MLSCCQQSDCGRACDFSHSPSWWSPQRFSFGAGFPKYGTRRYSRSFYLQKYTRGVYKSQESGRCECSTGSVP